MSKTTGKKTILSFLLVVVSFLAFVLNVFVLVFNSHLTNQSNPKFTSDPIFQGKQGPMGYNGIPGFLTMDERAAESWPITLLYEKNKTGKNTIFGDLIHWFSPTKPPSFQIDKKTTTLKLNFYNQIDKIPRKFHRGDVLFFDIDIALNAQKPVELGVLFEIKNSAFQNHLPTEYTKVWKRWPNQKSEEEFKKFNSLPAKQRAHFMFFKNSLINRVQMKGRIIFSYDAIYINVYSSLLDKTNVINQILSTSKMSFDTKNDEKETYIIESIQIGKIDLNGVLISDDDLSNPVWKDGTKIKIWQSPNNHEFIPYRKWKQSKNQKTKTFAFMDIKSLL